MSPYRNTSSRSALGEHLRDIHNATRIAVGIPAHNEAERISACVESLLNQSGRGADIVVIMANNCQDETADRLRRVFGDDPRLDLREVSLQSRHAHVGWARRLALDAAADHLHDRSDILMTTDADTIVAPDWVEANLRHLQQGCEVVAGAAHLMRTERAELSPAHQRRLSRVGKYMTALAYLRADQAPPHDPWPRHDYEGGASIALKLDVYRAIGGSPVLPTGEDRALFDAARAHRARIRHATDVRVFTSCRLAGRAFGGTADTLELWGALGEDQPAHGLSSLMSALQGCDPPTPLCFKDLGAELLRAQALIRAKRAQAAASFRPGAATAQGDRRRCAELVQS